MITTKTELKDLLYRVNAAAIEVHKYLGPGLLESVYHRCLKHELNLRGIRFVSELQVPVQFKGESLEANLRCDFFIEGILIVEMKAIDLLLPIQDAQLLTYMKLLRVPEGVLYNFNVANLYFEGQKTLVNEYYRQLRE